LDAAQNNTPVAPLIDEAILYFDETILDDNEEMALSETSNFSSRFVDVANKNAGRAQGS